VQHELDIARDAADTARKHSEHTSRSAQDEIGQWRDRCDGLEDELRRMEDEKVATDANGSGSVSSGIFGQECLDTERKVTDVVSGWASCIRSEERDTFPG